VKRNIYSQIYKLQANYLQIVDKRQHEMGGAHSTYGGRERVLVVKPEAMRPLGRLRRRWEDNIKMSLQEVGWWAWTGLVWLE
jgi:hypothetical protein